MLLPSYCLASTFQVDQTYFAAGAQTIDFENGGYQVLPEVEGVLFIQEVLPSNFWGNCGSGLFGLRGYTNIVRGDPYSTPSFTDLAIEFSRPVYAVGGWVGNIYNFLSRDAPLVHVVVFDQEHNLLAERNIDLISSGGTPLFLGLASHVAIGRIEWRGLHGGFFGVDNVVFSSSVPSPRDSGASWIPLLLLDD